MKTLKNLFVLFALIFALSSCVLEPDHSIRIENKFSETINNTKIGSVSYGTIASGETTGYKPVEEGTHTLSGSTESGGTLTGSVSISGKGKHDWTMTVESNGTLSIQED